MGFVGQFVGEPEVNNSTKDDNTTEQSDLLFKGMQQLKVSLSSSADTGDFNYRFGENDLNVLAVLFDDDRVKYTCPAGSIPQGKRCVYCPVGTFFNVVTEVCESCTQGSYQPDEGQLSCLVCPQHTSTKVVNAKRSDDCQGDFVFPPVFFPPYFFPRIFSRPHQIRNYSEDGQATRG